MADSDFLVTISGAALSLLFYENVRSIGDQMGFLLGETLEFVVKTYTDSDNQVETVKIRNNIETVLRCTSPDLLHDSTGRINKENLKDLLRDKSKQVVGWFRFRQNTGLVPTLRDKMLHKEFASYFSGGNDFKEEYFVTCLLSSSMTPGRGTHKFRHVFLKRRRGTFEPVSLKINNLGNDSFRHDGSDYKPIPTKKSSDTPDVFSKLIESLNLDLTRTAGFESAITIQKAAEQYLHKLIPQVCASDQEVADLEKQVRELKNEISQRKLSKKAKVNGSSDIVDQNIEVENSGSNDEAQTLEETPPQKIRTSDYICDITRLPKGRPTSAGQPVFKPRDTATYIENTISQGKSRTDMHPMNSRNPQFHVNTISEMKVDGGISVVNKNRRSTDIDSDIVKVSICKKEEMAIGVGRGGRKIRYETSPGIKSKQTSGPLITRSASESTSHSHASQQTSTDAVSTHNAPQKMSYNQAVKKPVGNTRNITDSSDHH